MEDIAPKLFEEVKKVFNEKLEKDAYVDGYLKKLKNGAVDFSDTQLYAKQLGTLLGNTFKEVLKEEVLPDGRLYWNIAERVMSPMLNNNYELVNTASMATQKIIDLKDNIGLQPLKPHLSNERIKGLLDNVTVEGLEFSEVQKRMYEPVINITESFFDDFIKTNADFRYKAGLRPQIIRTLKGKACYWCKSLAGVYDYGEIGIDSDVFRRHQNCHCQVIYKTSKDKQDVWSKEITAVEKSDKDDILKESIVNDAIISGRVSKEINKHKQNRHILNSNGYIEGRSYLYGDLDYAQKLVDELSGTGEPVMLQNGGWMKKEKVESDSFIGVLVDETTKEETKTNKFTIHYSKTGTHVVPRKGK